jgi:hypothetical protein
MIAELWFRYSVFFCTLSVKSEPQPNIKLASLIEIFGSSTGFTGKLHEIMISSIKLNFFVFKKFVSSN